MNLNYFSAISASLPNPSRRNVTNREAFISQLSWVRYLRVDRVRHQGGTCVPSSLSQQLWVELVWCQRYSPRCWPVNSSVTSQLQLQLMYPRHYCSYMSPTFGLYAKNSLVELNTIFKKMNNTHLFTFKMIEGHPQNHYVCFSSFIYNYITA